MRQWALNLRSFQFEVARLGSVFALVIVLLARARVRLKNRH
ncbi:hypothetical protein [Cryobacterium sp. TMT1-66-1]|nr:hypothetical protein [Cryobacterium sp. TMT1-66-1]